MCPNPCRQLSLIAFTTGLPIAYITDAYATWSRKLNRHISDSLGDATSVASEARGQTQLFFFAFGRSIYGFSKFVFWRKYGALSRVFPHVEAMGNIRTVKAMSTERDEIGDYDFHTKVRTGGKMRSKYGLTLNPKP